MLSSIALLGRDDSASSIKEGSVAVRGRYIWRDRFVEVRLGEVVVRRWKGGAVKKKIDLRDETTKLTFHEDQNVLSISNRGGETILNCGSTTNRNEWLAALACAQEIDTEESGAFIVSDSDDSSDSSPSQSLSSSTLSFTLNSGTVVDVESSEAFNDVLLALQDVRDSLLQCNLSMSSASEDQLLVSPKSELHDQQEVDKSDKQFHADSLQAICQYIESTTHGGRVILLHLSVLASANISLHEILRALGERQRDTTRAASISSSAISQHKQHAGKFVRDLLFHPIYSKHPSNTSDLVQDAVDRYFPHCRLRRFSDDTEHLQEDKPVASLPSPQLVHTTAPQSVVRGAIPVVNEVVSTNSDETCAPPCPDHLSKKIRPHSVPSIISTHGKTNTSQDNKALWPSTESTQLGCPCSISLPRDDRALLLEPLKVLLWKCSSAELAEELTILHHQQLRQILLWEFLHNPREAAQELTEHFNRLVSYFLWSVLVEETPKDRAEVIEAIIAVAHAASSPPLNNFHLVMICVGCLGDIPLMRSRLPATWKKVRNKYMVQLAELRALCDHSGGFDNLRRKQAGQDVVSSREHACCFIPFIGVIGVALERLRMTSYLTSRKTLDLEKLDRQYQVLHVLESAMMKTAPRRHTKEDHKRSFSDVPPASASTECSNTVTALVEHDMQVLFGSLSMSFATPRLYQLRSQQIMASETTSLNSASSPGSRAASALFLASQSRTSSLTNSAASTASFNLSSSPTGPRLSLTSSTAVIDDYHSPFLSFRLVCEMIASIPNTRERVDAALEALFADDRQPATRHIRRFWHDLRQLMPQVSSLSVLRGIRECVSALERDVLTFKGGELAQLSGLDESSPQLQLMVYEKLLALVTQPVFVWVASRVKLAMSGQENHLKEKLAKNRAASSVAVLAAPDSSVPSPLDLLESVVQLVGAPTQASPASLDDLAESLARANGSWVASHPFASLVLLRNLLEPSRVTAEQRRCLDALERSLADALGSTGG